MRTRKQDDTTSSSATSDDDEEAEELKRELDQMKRLARSAKRELLRKVKRHKRKVPWALPRGYAKRLAPTFLLGAYKDGKTVIDLIEKFGDKKDLTGHHLYDTLLLVARAIHEKVMDEAEPEMINSEATELLVRKLYGTIKAFDLVESCKDWEVPKGGAPRGWKSKVNYDVIREYDSLADDSLGVAVPASGAELRRRLKDQALLRKHLSGEAAEK